MYYDHDFNNGDGGKTDKGNCIERIWSDFYNDDRPCNKPAYSVVHRPDQFRHWCSILEAGGDCMHMEMAEDDE